jgi:hypothetical protein
VRLNIKGEQAWAVVGLTQSVDEQQRPAMVVAFDFDCTDFEVVNFGKLGLAAGLLGRPAAFGSGINPYE